MQRIRTSNSFSTMIHRSCNRLGQQLVALIIKGMSFVGKPASFPKLASALFVIFLLHKHIAHISRKHSGLLYLKPLPPTTYVTNLSEYISNDGILIPSLMNWIRMNETIPSFIIEDQENRSKTYTGICSCENIKAAVQCCKRKFFVTHKMGYVLISSLWYTNKKQFTWAQVGESNNFRQLIIPNTDHRSVLLIRNIYDAIVSGYRYHKNGNECWLNPTGVIDNWFLTFSKTQNFTQFLKLPLLYNNSEIEIINTTPTTTPNDISGDSSAVPPVQRYDSNLCEYLQHYNVKDGLKVYIDYVFHLYYKGMLRYWGLTQGIQSMKDRTLFVCYKDMTSINNDLQTLNNAIGFLQNRSNYTWESYSSKRPGGPIQYTGGHSTSTHASKNETQYLLSLIHELDNEVFNNEIAWMYSVLPCQ